MIVIFEYYEILHSFSIYIYIHTYIHIYIHTHIYIHICRERERNRERERERYPHLHVIVYLTSVKQVSKSLSTTEPALSLAVGLNRYNKVLTARQCSWSKEAQVPVAAL